MPPTRHGKRIYLDTSVISALSDEQVPERQRMTLDFWKKLDQHDVFISSVVLDELAAAPEHLREHFLQRVGGFGVLALSDDIEDLALRYVEQGVFSERYFNDAFHVAIATIHRMEYLVSWNFAHLVKVRTRHAVNLVNALAGYTTIEIIAPPEF